MNVDLNNAVVNNNAMNRSINLPRDPNVIPDTISKRHIIMELKKQLDDSNKTISSQKDTISNNRKQEELINSDNSRLSQIIAELRDYILDQQTLIDKLKIQVNELSEKNTICQNVILQLKEKETTNKTRINNLETIHANFRNIAQNN